MNTQLLLEKRKDRLIAAVLSYKDREIDKFLPDDVSWALRKFLLTEINNYYTLVYDVLEENINEDFVEMFEMLTDLHEEIIKE